MLQQFDVFREFRIEEIVAADELAYERGSYRWRLTDKASSLVVNEVVSARYIGSAAAKTAAGARVALSLYVHRLQGRLQQDK